MNTKSEMRRLGRKPTHDNTDKRTEEEKQEDKSITIDTRRALSTALHYYFLVSGKNRVEDLKKIREIRPSFLDSDLTNFLSHAGDKGAAVIFNYYKTLLHGDIQYFMKMPKYVQRAIREVYGWPEGFLISPSIANVFNTFSDGSDKYLDNISKAYAGIWNMFRYAGHGRDPRIMWAVMQIVSRNESGPNSLPTFKIKYKPEGGHPGVIEGAIQSLAGGQHMLFIGYDHPSNYPFDILATQVQANDGDEQIEEIHGLIKRRHESGRIMSARTLCLRAKNETLEKAAKNVDAYEEANLKELFEDLYPSLDFETEFVNKIKNRTRHEGKFALFL